MTTISGAEVLLKCLIQERVRYIFGVPGDQWTPFLDAIYRLGREAGLDFVTTRHEQAAAHMADAWTRVTGEVGVCLGTVGPGAADLVPGVYPAWADSIPMLVLTAQNQSWRSYPDHGSMQALDQVPLFAPITKWNAFVSHWQRIPELVQRAFRTATSGKPGPVHLDIPPDVLVATGDEEELTIVSPQRYRATTPPAGDPALVERAAEMLARAERPLIHAGGGVLRAGAWEELVALAEYLAAPVTTSVGARGIIPEDHPLCLIPSSYGALGAQATADLVLFVGGRLGDLDFWGRPPAWGELDEQTWIQVDIYGESIALNRLVDLAIVGDAKAVLRDLLAAVKERTPQREEWPEIEDARAAQETWLRGFLEQAKSDDAPIHPLRLVREVRNFFPREAICAVDGGTTAVWAFYLNRIYAPRTFLWAADSGHLGTGLPYAIGAKLARPDVPVYCITGDGSFALNAVELETAVRLGAPIVVIVFNDRAWGMIKGGQKLAYEGRTIGVDFTDARYDKLAEALGCYGERVTQPDQIRPALERAVESGRPAVLDVIVDPEVHILPPDLEVLDALWMEGCR
ncbi:MAG TPA: thiamine pyrophosphate-binding protein [Anaerolineae bacterium]|nr:thiamine pyrophosphate-binding protein [Anaerolineae bacterium]